MGGSCLAFSGSVGLMIGWFFKLFLVKVFHEIHHTIPVDEGTSGAKPGSVGHERQAAVPGHPDQGVGHRLLRSTTCDWR